MCNGRKILNLIDSIQLSLRRKPVGGIIIHYTATSKTSSLLKFGIYFQYFIFLYYVFIHQIYLAKKLLYMDNTLSKTRNTMIRNVYQISVEVRDVHSNERNVWNMSKKWTPQTFSSYFITAYCDLWIHISHTFFWGNFLSNSLRMSIFLWKLH